MQYIMFFVFLGANTLHADAWSPPENPDPQTILQEGRADTHAKRYEIALAKHVWFYEHALTVDPAFYGVRLSFALSYWMELAKQYPLAMTRLKEIRDAAQRNVVAGRSICDSFHDMASINDRLGEPKATIETFEVLDEKNPTAARKVFDFAQPSLFKDEAYALIVKYISPRSDLAKMRDGYLQDKKLAEDARFGARHLEFANKKFANDTTTLVAILTVNDRNKEAEEIAASARAEWADDSFHTALEKALKGVVPDPWP